MEPIKSFTVKEDHIGKSVFKILHYKQRNLTTLYNRMKNNHEQTKNHNQYKPNFSPVKFNIFILEHIKK